MPWGMPGDGGCGCAARAKPHRSFICTAPRPPLSRRCGLGCHLVLLEVSLHRSAVLSAQSPEQGQPQHPEQCALHLPGAEGPSCDAAGSGELLFMGRLRAAPGGSPGPPAPLCKREQGRAAEPKGRQGSCEPSPPAAGTCSGCQTARTRAQPAAGPGPSAGPSAPGCGAAARGAAGAGGSGLAGCPISAAQGGVPVSCRQWRMPAWSRPKLWAPLGAPAGPSALPKSLHRPRDHLGWPHRPPG